MNKKLLTLLCVLALLVAVFCVSAAATEENAVAEMGGTYYSTLVEAIGEVTDSSNIITLLQDVENAIFDTTVYLDLNGKNIDSVTVSKDCTLYCFDNTTDEYEVTYDENDRPNYGRLRVAKDSEGAIVGVPAGDGFDDSYLMVTEDAGISFHRVTLKIDTTTLRPKNNNESAYNPGMYYKSTFAGDQLVAEKVTQFGIALSVVEEPNADNFGINNKCSSYTNFVAGADGNATLSSTYVKNIMMESNGRLTNTANTKMPIYGRAYILTDDGYVFGKSLKYTFQELIQDLSKTNDPEKLEKAVPLYKVYGNIMRNWEDMSNLESAVIRNVNNNVLSTSAERKAQPLRVLAITSSFGKNTTELLYEILTAEGYEDVTVARLYSSGGTLKEHAENAENDNGYYQYTVLNKEYYEKNNGKWEVLAEDYKVTKEPGYKISDALTEENWDIIFVQQSAAHSPQLNTYSNYIDRLMAALAVQNPNHANTKYIWNMTWAYQSDHVDDVFSRYNYDQMTMYQSCVKAVQQKVVHRTDFDAIIPSGTAIQNARTSYIGDTLTTDGRHANGLGRAIAGYTLYATITGQPLDEIQLTAIENTDPTYDIDRIDLTVGEKAIIKESVNNALATPFQVTESTITTDPTPANP